MLFRFTYNLIYDAPLVEWGIYDWKWCLDLYITWIYVCSLGEKVSLMLVFTFTCWLLCADINSSSRTVSTKSCCILFYFGYIKTSVGIHVVYLPIVFRVVALVPDNPKIPANCTKLPQSAELLHIYWAVLLLNIYWDLRDIRSHGPLTRYV